jgi:predicted TIM-barrel enzyme
VGGKKKSQPIARISVIDDLSASASLAGGSGVAVAIESGEPRRTDLESAILLLVKDDPFITISEIKRAINGRSERSPVGWWQIFGILRRWGLLTKRARFKFLRGQR